MTIDILNLKLLDLEKVTPPTPLYISYMKFQTLPTIGSPSLDWWLMEFMEDLVDAQLKVYGTRMSASHMRLYVNWHHLHISSYPFLAWERTSLDFIVNMSFSFESKVMDYTTIHILGSMCFYNTNGMMVCKNYSNILF